jgi:metal-responsive CopG/Arc/MetJ family transcriptional regulator
MLMTTTQRVTITLPADVLERTRELADGNLSGFISDVLREYFEEARLQQLHDALVAAAIAKAEEDLETAAAFRYAEDEAVALYVPPYHESEKEEARTMSATTVSTQGQ